MPSTPGEKLPPRWKSRLTQSGEGLIALVGVSLGGLMVLVCAAWAWWGIDSHRQTAAAARKQEVGAVADIAAAWAAQALKADGQGQFEALRHFLKSTARDHQLEVCRITLANGQVVADIDPLAKLAVEIPETWGDAAEKETEAAVSRAGRARVVIPFIVAKRGAANLEVEGPITFGSAASSPVVVSGALIGTGSILALLFAISRLRRRMAAIEAVRASLVRAAEGEQDLAMLEVNAELGKEAVGWNAVLARKDEVRKVEIAQRSTNSLKSPVQREGDLHSAFDALVQGVIVLDNEGRIRQANGAAAVLLGAKREALVGADIATALAFPEVVQAAKDMTSGKARQRKMIEVSNTGQTPESEAAPGVLRFNIRPVRKDDKASAIIVIEDVTQLKVADEARTAFVAQATHELRTPLTNMRLYVEQLLDDDTDQQTRSAALNVVNQEIRRLERIITDMLSVSEIESGSMQIRAGDVRMDAMFTELENDFKAQAQSKDITLTFNLSPKLPVLQGDRDKVAVALHNLVGNALKYTPAGGTIVVKADTKDDLFNVEVADNGIGIAAEETDLIFDKFYRARDRRIASITGTGLGLTLAREIARLHGGDVTIKSQIDKGSTFTLSLPTSKAA